MMVCNGYTYTRPRRPVAASYKGPGPCYALPALIGHSTHDPRSSHARGPAFQFGLAANPDPRTCSPGPCYRPDPKLTRSGRNGDPSYSMYSRRKELEPFRTPGPGAYPFHVVRPITKPSSPAYTFGGVWTYSPLEDTPGPNIYSVPSAIGKTVESGKIQFPLYSIYGRSKTGNFYDDVTKTPSPVAYRVPGPNTYKTKSAQYSITGRNLMPGDASVKPGPGAHSPERVTINKPHLPQFSFGIRHSEYMLPNIQDHAPN